MSASPTRRPRTGAEIRGYARNRLIESRLTPNAISMTGLVLNVAGAVLILERAFVLAGIAFMVGSIMDTLDGRYSRMSGKGTQFGAFLDSTLDRIEEGVVIAAIAWHFADQGDQTAAAICVLVVLGSVMVSYTRARAEALAVECKLGIATRPVRVVILTIGIFLADGELIDDVDLLPAAIYVLGVLTAFTAAQRIWHVRSVLTERAREAGVDVEADPDPPAEV
ncbi:MAG: CDP-alcohol phosphatidyltransferase family protein [Solirubrobacterales bacterium]